MNNIILTGRLTHEPECSFIPGSKTLVCKFNLAVSRDFKNKNGEYDTDFIPVELMGKAAEFCANYITKGRLVGVQGSIRVDRYETPEGDKRTFTKVAGRSIQTLDSLKQEEDSSNAKFSAVEDDDVPF